MLENRLIAESCDKEDGNDELESKISNAKVEEYNPKLKEEQVNGGVELAFDFGF